MSDGALLAQVCGLDVSFPRPGTAPDLAVLDAVDLEVREGEFVALVGPSGSGKSTLVRALAGLLPAGARARSHDDADRGADGPDPGPAGPGPDSRGAMRAYPVMVAQRDDLRRPGRQVPDVAWMGQTDALLPWRRALSNAALGARLAGLGPQDAERRARDLMERFGLGGFERSWPHELSGGMRQRLALARTVLAGRRLLLLDEPFSGLDALTRRSLNAWLAHADLVASGAAGGVVLVTHDVDEALTLAHRVVVLSARPGRVLADLPTGGRTPEATADLRRRILGLLGVAAA